MGLQMEYKVKYDPTADALYIKIKEDKIKDTTEIDTNIIVDYNEKGEIIGIEILNFSKTKINLNQLITKGIEATITT